MNRIVMALVAFGLMAVVAAPAVADTSARDIQAALDTYLENETADVNLVGGPGSAGYDQGFWIRGGDFLLRTNLTLQARYEWMDFDETTVGEPTPGGDLSGFSLPRATLKFSGEAPCNIRYYMELEFGHWGRDTATGFARAAQNGANLGPENQSWNFDNTREAWIEWGCSDMLNVRMGQIAIPTTRQLMVAPELQQFADISLASAAVGQVLPGYTDRNRDHGIMFHGSFGCDNTMSWMLAVTNGDGGDSIRNVLDNRTSDGLAVSGRFNWAFAKPIGYQEGALNQETCGWYGEIGAWGFYYADRSDKPHTSYGDMMRYGVDLALGYGGFSFTGAFNMGTTADIGGVSGADRDYTAWLAQLGYHFPGTAWEIAARASAYNVDNGADANVMEYGVALNYYLNGHGNKFTIDASLISGSDPGSALLWDPYTGYGNFGTGDQDYGMLVRFQWQLAL